MAYLGVVESAEKLGVSPRRIRQLIDAGALDALRIGRSWLVEVASVEERSRSRSHSGRPLALKSAWRLAVLAEGHDGERMKEEGLSASERWRARRALIELLEDADLLSIDSKLRARCDRVEHRFAHPSVLEKLAADNDLVLSGQRAASMLGSDLVSDDRIEAYVHERDVGRVDSRYRLQQADASDANVHLRVLSGSDLGWKSHVAPRLLVAVDLAHSLDARAQRAAQGMLASVRA